MRRPALPRLPELEASPRALLALSAAALGVGVVLLLLFSPGPTQHDHLLRWSWVFQKLETQGLEGYALNAHFPPLIELCMRETYRLGGRPWLFDLADYTLLPLAFAAGLYAVLRRAGLSWTWSGPSRASAGTASPTSRWARGRRCARPTS